MTTKMPGTNGGGEIPPEAKAIADAYLARRLALEQPQNPDPAADPQAVDGATRAKNPVKKRQGKPGSIAPMPSPADQPPSYPETEEGIAAYLEDLEKQQQNVSPFRYSKAHVLSAEKEMAGNNRLAARNTGPEIVIKPESIEPNTGDANPSLFPDFSDPDSSDPGVVKQKRQRKPKVQAAPAIPSALPQTVPNILANQPDSDIVTVDGDVPDLLESSFATPPLVPGVSGMIEQPFDREANAQRIKALNSELSTARADLITFQDSQQSAWKSLTQMFRGLTHQVVDDRDLDVYRSAYNEKLLALQSAELDRVRHAGLVDGDLRQEMAGLIRQFAFTEAEKYDDESRDIRLTKTNRPLLEKIKNAWGEFQETLAEGSPQNTTKAELKALLNMTLAIGGTAMQGIEKLGVGYNKVTRGKAGKYLLGATVAGAGAVALGAASGGTAAVVVGALALKRLIAGAGMAVMTEAALEKIARTRRAQQSQDIEVKWGGMIETGSEKVQAVLDEVAFDVKEAREIRGQDTLPNLAALEKYLQEEIAGKAHEEAAVRRRGALLRKSAAIFAGAVFGSGVASHFVSEHFGSHIVDTDMSDASLTPGSVETEVGMEPASMETAPVVSPADGAVPVDAVKEIAVSGEAGGVVVESQQSIMPETSTAGSTVAGPDIVPDAIPKALLSTYEVKRGDSIWKLAERAVQGAAGMDERSTERFAKLVELKLQEKLNADAVMAKAAGFTPDSRGVFSPHMIRAGAKLELGKIFSSEELTQLVDDARGTGSIKLPTPPISLAEVPHTGGVMHGLKLDTPSVGLHMTPEVPPTLGGNPAQAVTQIVDTADIRPDAALLRPGGQVMDYVDSVSQEEKLRIFRNFKQLSNVLFETDEAMEARDYTQSFDPIPQTELMKTKLMTVLSDHRLLTQSPISSYDRTANPLHWSHMKAVTKFVTASGKVFGVELVRARDSETIQEYVLRMAALASHLGKKIPGYRMLD